jgi:NAD kinase
MVRPTVVSMDRSLSIQMGNPKLRAMVVADGRFQRELTQDVKLAVRKSEHQTVFVRVAPEPPLGSLTRLHLMEPARL